MEVEDKWLCPNEHSWVRGEQSGPKGSGGEWDTSSWAQKAWWRWEMSSCAQMDTIGSEMSNQAQRDLVEGGTQAVGLKGPGEGGRQAIRLKGTWWRQETSSCTQIDMVGSETSNWA